MAEDKKRKRSSSSSSQKPYDNFSFRSVEHEVRYKTKIINRNFVQERAITLETGEYPEIREQIRIRGWETLVSYPKPGCKELVKEFYANAYKDNKFMSYVRGHWIHFDSKTLNDFLKTRNPRACEYVRLKSEKVNAEKLLETLCKPGTQWRSMSKIKNEPRKLKSTELKPIPKAWSTFVHHTLSPCANVSDVIVSRAQLVYAIVTGLEVDVGSLVAHNIQEIANDNTATLGYPSLITQLCLDAGVEVSEDEIPIKPMAPINAKFIKKYAIEIEAEQPAPPKKQKEKESLSLEKRMERLEGNVGALCKLAVMILQSQQSLQNMVTSLGEQLHLDVYTMGGLSSTPMNEEEVLAHVNFEAMESELKERLAPQQPQGDEVEED